MKNIRTKKAFEILLDELEYLITDMSDIGARAFQKGDYDKARQAADEAARLTDFRNKVQKLQNEWAMFFSKHTRRQPERGKRKMTKQLRYGVKTPLDAYRRPILEILVEMGGSGPTKKILKLVEQKMRNILNEYDYQPLPSNPTCPRWDNTAQWCRKIMVDEGLLRSDSPRGIWEISEAGRRALDYKELP